MILTFQRNRYPPAWLKTCPTEAQIQDAILAYLRARGILAWAVDAGGRALRRGQRAHGAIAPTGHADVLGVLPGGRLLAIEVKRPEWLGVDGRQIKRPGRPSLEQRAWLREVEAAGAVAGVAWSVGDVVGILEFGIAKPNSARQGNAQRRKQPKGAIDEFLPSHDQRA